MLNMNWYIVTVYKVQSGQKLTEKMWTLCMKRVTSYIQPFVLGSFVVLVMCVNIRYVNNVNENTLEIHSHLLAVKISKIQKEITSQIKLFSITTFLFIHSFHWHVQNATIPCRSRELLPFQSVM
jgi:hypothetical protein